MGSYLNPGNEKFRQCLNSEIYIDKTGLIKYCSRVMDSLQKYICMSRPRRFGKSVTADMLAAYYSCGCDSGELFKGFRIESHASFEEHLNKYDVLFFNMQRFLSRAKDQRVTDYLEKTVIAEIRKVYGDFFSEEESDLSVVLEQIYVETDRQFIFLIDEWDCVMREKQEAEGLQRQYLDFLRNLLKDQPYVALAYMTGILPVKKYGSHSALNMFAEYSMTDQDIFEEYTGFTEDEVKELCERFSMDFGETESWYDGYKLIRFQHIYNPKSVSEAMRRHRFSNYWTSTETYEALRDYIDMNFDGLKDTIINMLGENTCKVDTGSFQNDMTSMKSRDDVLTLLIHLGYLAYDEKNQTVCIPNTEIKEEFIRAIRNGNRKELMKAVIRSDALLSATWSADGERAAEIIGDIHNEETAIDFYNNEQALRSVIRFAYICCIDEFKEIQELPSRLGYAGIVYLPKKNSSMPILVIELKWNQKPSRAIQQIKEKNYPQIFEGYGSDILLVGISYDEKTKKHECVIERSR